MILSVSYCSSLSDHWLVMSRSPLGKSGKMGKLVSLQTSNIHSSSTDDETRALPFFKELLEGPEATSASPTGAQSQPHRVDPDELRQLVKQAEVLTYPLTAYALHIGHFSRIQSSILADTLWIFTP